MRRNGRGMCVYSVAGTEGKQRVPACVWWWRCGSRGEGESYLRETGHLLVAVSLHARQASAQVIGVAHFLRCRPVQLARQLFDTLVLEGKRVAQARRLFIVDCTPGGR